MAYVYSRPGSQYFMAAFKTPAGQWMRRSTKLTKESEALRMSFLWDGVGATLQLETPTGAQVDKVIREVWERFSGKRLELTPTRDFMGAWIDRMRSSRSAKTGERYRKVIDDFLEHLGERADLDIRAVTVPDVQGFIDRQTRAGLSGTTIGLNAKILRACFNAAIRAGAVEKNPAGMLDTPEAAHEERQPFSLGEINALLAAAKGTDWETAILIAAFAGLRLGDATNLQWASVDLAAKMLAFVPQKVRRKKRELRVPIHATLYRHLDALASRTRAKRSPFVCPDLAGREVGGRAGLSAEFMALMDVAGIDAMLTDEKEGAGHRFSRKSFHSLRHAFVTGLANRGVAADVRQKLAGHADEKMVARYSHLADSTLRRAVAKLPAAGKRAS